MYVNMLIYSERLMQSFSISKGDQKESSCTVAEASKVKLITVNKDLKILIIAARIIRMIRIP